VALTSGNVIVTDNKGGVFGLDKASGSAMWSQTGLARRSLTGPAIHGDYVVVGDYKGYLHWLRTDNGELAARAKSGGDALLAQPVVADGILLVQNVDGKLTAFRLAQ
jgi:outer membrane protein assembly factor BamB